MWRVKICWRCPIVRIATPSSSSAASGHGADPEVAFGLVTHRSSRCKELPDRLRCLPPGLVDRAGEDEPALVQEHHPLGDPNDQRDVVRHHHRGHPEMAIEVEDQLGDGLAGDRVEAGGRLVVEHDLRLEGEGSGHRDPLAHAAGQLGRLQLASTSSSRTMRKQLGALAPAAPRARASRARGSGRRCCRTRSSSRTARRPGTGSETRRRTGASSASDSSDTGWPRTLISPASGGISPLTVFKRHRLAGAGGAEQGHGRRRARRRATPRAGRGCRRRTWRHRAAR